YSLPAGIGVFHDPATVDVASVGAVFQAGLRQQILNTDTLAATVTLGRGVDLARNRISVQSALLDVRAQSTDVTQFTTVEVNIASPKVHVARYRPSFNLAARKYDGHGYSVMGKLIIPLHKGSD